MARLTYLALFALQHRGQESSGIATSDGSRIWLHKGMGLASGVFDEHALSHLPGSIAVGHNRYSTTGSSRAINSQPIIVNGSLGEIAIVHNGNLVNTRDLRNELLEQGFEFSSTTDSEVIINLIIASQGATWQDKIAFAMGRLRGSYSTVILAYDKVIAFRDPLGVRPLSLGSLNGCGWIVASETCALDHIGAQFVREVNPGEIVVIDQDGITGIQGLESQRRALCVFEYIYFARPDSVINGRLLYQAREAMGKALAQEFPVDADMVIGIPDSATIAGIGYAQKSRIPFSEGLVKNRYVGRTFIQPDQRSRDLGVRRKFNPLPEVLKGKRLVVVDDSIVRGSTTPHVISLLRKAGAKEIHLRVCAPPICFPCFFGVDMATRRELIASQKTVPEIKDFVGADTLGYLSLDGLIESIGLPKEILCLACLTGDYPIPVQLEMDNLVLEPIQAVKSL